MYYGWQVCCKGMDSISINQLKFKIMESIFSIEIKKSVYCGIKFYSLYVDGKLHHNYSTLKEAKTGFFAVIELSKVN